jgi:protein O-GlcNAc transferase
VLPLAPFRPPASRWTRAELGIAADAVVLEAFVGLRKLSPRCVELWRAVLAQAPAAVLLLSPPRDDDRAALLRRLAQFGVAPARVRFVPYDVATLHDRHALADAALDTMPYTGGATTTAALAAGVPVVTRIGARHAERMTASVLRHAGLPQLVASTDGGYVALAVRLATDRAFREAQRAAVRAALAVPALTHAAVYTRALETAYLRALTERRLLPH